MIEIMVVCVDSPHCLLVRHTERPQSRSLIIGVVRTREVDAWTYGIDIVTSRIHTSATTVKFPLYILFLCSNSLSTLWMNLLWCFLLLHLRYTKISVKNKTRPRLQDEQKLD